MHQAEADIPGARVAFETGRLASQAAGACTASNGPTQILGTVSFQQDDGLRFREALEHFEVSNSCRIFGLSCASCCVPFCLLSTSISPPPPPPSPAGALCPRGQDTCMPAWDAILDQDGPTLQPNSSLMDAADSNKPYESCSKWNGLPCVATTRHLVNASHGLLL